MHPPFHPTWLHRGHDPHPYRSAKGRTLRTQPERLDLTPPPPGFPPVAFTRPVPPSSTLAALAREPRFVARPRPRLRQRVGLWLMALGARLAGAAATGGPR